MFADFQSWCFDGFLNILIVVGVGSFLVKRWLKNHDKEGEIKGAVHGAAKKGVLGVIGRMLKK